MHWTNRYDRISRYTSKLSRIFKTSTHEEIGRQLKRDRNGPKGANPC